MDIKYAYEKYKELKTLKATAKYLHISAEWLRKQFIKHKLPYAKKIVYVCDDSVFDNNNPDAFYWAGFMAADGNVSKQNDISIALKKSDFQHLIKFQHFLKSDTIISEHINKARDIKIKDKIYHIENTEYVRIRIRNDKLAKDLKRFNIVPNKTKIYDIPNWIIDHSLVHHFIRGYFDGDGWFSTIHNKQYNKNKIVLGICGNLSVINTIQNILRANCYISGKPQLVKQGAIYKLTFSKQHDVSNIIDYIYKNANTYLYRKFELAKLAKQFDASTVILNLNKEELISSYHRLKSYNLMAQEFNCAKSTIAKYMKKFNLVGTK